MNDGKTYSFFSWAATARQDAQSGSPKPWVPPDFIIKADDDSFVMLAELEAHLRVELHGGPLPRHYNKSPVLIAPPASSNQSTVYHAPNDDPLIYWGYTVKNRFMGGELYALSHSLVDWISKDPGAKEHVTGAEDQVTARWVRWHPRADDVRWVRERCWIYDHPKAGTVYSRGFLFPSEAKRVQTGIISDIQRWYKSYKSYKSPLSPGRSSSDVVPEDFVPVFGPHGETPSSWVLSSVSTFQVRYSPPVPGLSSDHSIEALVEGSDMSRLTKWNATAADEAWQNREGRIRRYEGKRVEAATALLEGEDYTEGELAQGAAEASPHFAELAATWDR
ncbi:hypothetical protein EW026_g955 [Hermanssonia centrifuga]|uniref:Uncharacterized protein n=1 Tax=Hermanssonia centrifuga TaxID=98765 RepID=A0A4S4KUV2_9APHY|nr:hypothetical protein EW026_g955 [Hermanssonia centrifuga]